ncbi:zinc ribbon domain-containing protein [Paracerasibacillus soli]|uniref:Zinc ribbon domain-containing protein n=1 Tax=Paracerasibacillus soli TaxID=480284 RepID=A0ABU5CRL5_9BACI|nr:zinc ribbon domain-containing protein [Virgibacillus soli]MDY0408984.1 zinc ribbon domain-containing protein [Virgibacillus soli]
MYCQNCGEKLINDSMFCMNCGIEIKINATTPKESNENSPNQNSSRETTHSNESNKKGSENKADELVNKSVSPHHHSPVPHAVEQNTANKQTSDQNETKQTTTKLNRLMPTLPFLIPIVCFIIASLSVGFYYIYEDNQNDKVLKLQKSAEEAALNGAYKDAIERLNKAIDIRPNYKTLTEDLQEVERANDVFADIDTVHELITEQEFEKAKEKLNVLKEQIMEETGPLFISLNEKVANKEATLIIDEIKKS